MAIDIDFERLRFILARVGLQPEDLLSDNHERRDKFGFKELPSFNKHDSRQDRNYTRIYSDPDRMNKSPWRSTRRPTEPFFAIDSNPIHSTSFLPNKPIVLDSFDSNLKQLIDEQPSFLLPDTKQAEHDLASARAAYERAVVAAGMAAVRYQAAQDRYETALGEDKSTSWKIQFRKPSFLLY